MNQPANPPKETAPLLAELQRLIQNVPLDEKAVFSASLRLLQKGRPTEAGRGFERLIVENPRNAVYFNCLGIAHFNLRAFARAIECYDKAISINPYLAEAFSNRAGALGRLGRDADAETDCERALTINPRLAEAHNNLGNIYLGRGRLRPALAEFQRAIEISPSFEDAINNRIFTQLKLGAVKEAHALAADAVRTNPRNLRTILLAGEAAIADQAAAEAIPLLRRALHDHSKVPQVHHLLGLALFQTGALDKAIARSEEAIKLDSKLAQPYITIAASLMQLGKFKEALPYYDRAFEFSGDFSGAFFDLVKAKKFSASDDPHLLLIEAAIAKEFSQPPAGPPKMQRRRTNLLFAVGKVYDDLCRYEEAFKAFSGANEIERAALPYDEAAVVQRPIEIKKTFASGRFQFESRPGAEPRPIFIVGMPRSGTTLVEQVLAGCEGVFSAGELSVFGDLCRTICDARGETYPGFVDSAAAAEIKGIGADYERAVRDRSPASIAITDKMPTNFIYAGLILLALPHARIVHVSRDPCDTCLSCFMTPWKHMEKFNTDLRTLGRYYRAYFDVMAHWRSVLPGSAFLDVRYEDLIADPTDQTAKITDFCGLKWTPQVVEVQERAGAVKTASQFQVRQAIYKTSIGRWRNYEPWLKPLLEELGDLVADK